MVNLAARSRSTNGPRQVDKSLVLYDGVCHLCNGFVHFILRRDAQKHFQFGYLQSAEGQRILGSLPTVPEGLDTVVLIENGKVSTRSTAALRIARRLDRGWPLCYGFIIVPRFLRDVVYNLVSKHRYRFFGRSEQCLLPSQDYKERFID